MLAVQTPAITLSVSPFLGHKRPHCLISIWNVKEKGAVHLHFYLKNREHEGVEGAHEVKWSTVRGLETAGIRLPMEATNAVVPITLPSGHVRSYLNSSGR